MGVIAPGAMLTDLADPALNTSGTLYYRENYPHLQRIKARWDP